jgi:proteasome lid subunit RPN8/RPN11
MLGGLYREKRAGREYVEVGAYLPAPAAESGPASLKFTHDSWAALTRRASAEFPDMLVLGWHHTHPGLGVFLSGYDVFIHRNFFSQPWQFALVVDPKTREMGFFQWRGGEIVDCGFTLLRDK